MNHCIYCGGNAQRDVCMGHSDLKRLDPLYSASASQATDQPTALCEPRTERFETLARTAA